MFSGQFFVRASLVVSDARRLGAALSEMRTNAALGEIVR
jgi:hypothetical protein